MGASTTIHQERRIATGVSDTVAFMAEIDEAIGQNLQRLRGEMSQTVLASRMKALGHKWTQPTVVAVEKGERPLRLAEAKDIGEILGIDIKGLVQGPLTAQLEAALALLNDVSMRTRVEMDRWQAAVAEARGLVAAYLDGGPLEDRVANEQAQRLVMMITDLIERASTPVRGKARTDSPAAFYFPGLAIAYPPEGGDASYVDFEGLSPSEPPYTWFTDEPDDKTSFN